MIHTTKGQLLLLEQNLARTKPPGKARTRKQDLPENILEKQIIHTLSWHGYINVRQHVGVFTPYRVLRQFREGQGTDADMRNVVRIGEPGCADWLSMRVIIPAGGRACDGPHVWMGFFWEAKSPGKKPSEAQLAWLDKHRQTGFETAWFNQFQASDRPSSAVQPRDSHCFLTWFHDYFERNR